MKVPVALRDQLPPTAKVPEVLVSAPPALIVTSVVTVIVVVALPVKVPALEMVKALVEKAKLLAVVVKLAVALLVGAIVVVPLTVRPPVPSLTVNAKAEPAAGVTLKPELIVTALAPKV